MKAHLGGRLLLVLAASSAAVLAGVGAPEAPGTVAVHVSCGQVVTVNVTLDSDLSCTGDGIVIGAPHITVNLNGHTVDGDDGLGDFGILNASGFDRVRILNGRVTDFENGVLLSGGADDNVIAHIEVRSSSFDGIVIGGGDRNIVSTNVVVANGASGIGVGAQGDHNWIQANSVVGNGFGGILVVGGDNNVISGNEVTVNAGHGISVQSGATGNLVDSNRVFGSDAGNGVNLAAAPGNTITRNQSDGNEGNGISLSDSDSVLVESNSVDGNDLDGIDIGTGSDLARVRLNKALANHFHGISVFLGASPLLEGNVATGNGVDGIETDSPTSTLRHNTANANGDLGIDAVPGVTDGGGNRARANVDPAQCADVTCT
ncbi:MAG TPA: right-handed parallel beta-helix repeat-containing protein [Gaiellaceae bacterium]|nr:right-handed parallel beta-helix repeat-containing protein [Gaiellaceae bacterium]